MSMTVVTPALRPTSNRPRRAFHIALLLFVCALLTACPSHLLRYTGAEFYFAGRLALSVGADPNIAQSQPQSWSAHFELAGNPIEGTLRLSTPVGTTIAQVEWKLGHATVQTNEETLVFASLDELTSAYFNQSIPVAALFDWLAGKTSQQVVPGWEVNLSRAAKGVVSAERNYANTPHVKLRAVIDIHEENPAQEQTLSL